MIYFSIIVKECLVYSLITYFTRSTYDPIIGTIGAHPLAKNQKNGDSKMRAFSRWLLKTRMLFWFTIACKKIGLRRLKPTICLFLVIIPPNSATFIPAQIASVKIKACLTGKAQKGKNPMFIAENVSSSIIIRCQIFALRRDFLG